jgi:hypothetical protein
MAGSKHRAAGSITSAAAFETPTVVADLNPAMNDQLVPQLLA